ncbi:type 2 periplasmic-binding domain-containing protein [Paenirhodobacter populi]|uniref:Uncharacterized protein n=1 Tax=Paenirhodobacter populi TaxID=2306993 RepID=A0A443ILE6_9RHOB|nr:hypothetical protein [Sinirhodobacter populi]RWR05766.1 hypothetical protein D2T33_19480 [Sinirhodobacter populi]
MRRLDGYHHRLVTLPAHLARAIGISHRPPDLMDHACGITTDHSLVRALAFECAWTLADHQPAQTSITKTMVQLHDAAESRLNISSLLDFFVDEAFAAGPLAVNLIRHVRD